MARTVSIRRSLTLNMIAVIAFLSGAIMVTMAVGSRLAIKKLSQKVIDQTIAQTREKLGSFFDPVENELLRVKALGQKEQIGPDDFEQLRGRLAAIIRHYPQVTSLMIADESGRELMTLYSGGRWLIRQSGLKDDGRAKFTEWADTDESAVSVTWKEFDYDPRERPWYKGAAAKWNGCADPESPDNAEMLIYWTDPYRFMTTQEYGITVSTQFVRPDGSKCVIGFDILLKDIQTFTEDLKVLSYEQAVILTTDVPDNRRIVGFSTTEHYGDLRPDEDFMLKPPGDLKDPLVKKAIEVIVNQKTMEQGDSFRFFSLGKAWWVSEGRFNLTSDQGFLMAVIVPESDMLEDIRRSQLWVLGIVIVVLVLGVRRPLVLANRYSGPIELLVAESNRMSTGDLEAGEPIVSPVREVTALAEAHEKMRQGLKTLLKLEGDIQIAREIQQKTLPECVPQLAGFDIDGWNAPAEETGGDTYDVVGYEVDDATGAVTICNDSARKAIGLLADATGHGLGPALSVTQLRAMLRMAVRMRPDISVIAEHMNEQLCADLPEGRFITAWLGEIDTVDGCLRYFSAGQAPLLYYAAGEDTVEVLDADTFPLGIFEPLGASEVKRIDMLAGDIFAVISDGIYEAVDAGDEQFGTGRVVDIIKQNRDASAKAISEAIRAAVDQYTQSGPADDDRTIIIIKRTA